MTWSQFKRFYFYCCAAFCLMIPINIAHAMDPSQEQNNSVFLEMKSIEPDNQNENNENHDNKDSIKTNAASSKNSNIEKSNIKTTWEKYRFQLLFLAKFLVDTYMTYHIYNNIQATHEFEDLLESNNLDCVGMCPSTIVVLKKHIYDAYVAQIFYMLFCAASSSGDLISLATASCEDQCIKGGPNVCFLFCDLLKFICSLSANGNLWDGALNSLDGMPSNVVQEFPPLLYLVSKHCR